MKQVFLIHRWEGTPQSDWYPWLKSELENNGYKVIIPEMPNSDEPEIEAWVKKTEETVRLGEKTILVGHSIGCQTILRYLERLDDNKKVKAVVFVAPWLSLKNKALPDEKSKKIAKPWLETPIDFEKVRKHCDNFITIFSTNDPFVSVSQCDEFQRRLESKIIILKDRGHFTEDDGEKRVFKIFDEIIELDEISNHRKTPLKTDLEHESAKNL